MELDQVELATGRLQQLLTAALGRPVEVGNASASSWGPPNELAWLRRNGTLGAQVVVLVVSSHDADDAPEFDSIPMLDPGFGAPPTSALLEWIRTRVVSWRQRHRPAPSESELQERRRRCMAATDELLHMAAAAGARPVLALHRERGELGRPLPSGLDALAHRGRGTDVSVIDLGEVYEEAVSRGAAIYRDRIHLTAAGQALMAEALVPAISRVTKAGSEP